MGQSSAEGGSAEIGVRRVWHAGFDGGRVVAVDRGIDHVGDTAEHLQRRYGRQRLVGGQAEPLLQCRGVLGHAVPLGVGRIDHGRTLPRRPPAEMTAADQIADELTNSAPGCRPRRD